MTEDEQSGGRIAGNEHQPLSEHAVGVLMRAEMLVQELLHSKSVIPQDLYTKLDTYHADLTAAIQAKQEGT